MFKRLLTVNMNVPPPPPPPSGRYIISKISFNLS